MKKAITLIFSMALLQACASGTYSLVEAGTNDVGDFNITTAQDWNKAPKAVGRGNTMWTMDGPALNRITFFSGIEEGETLFKSRKRDQLAKFRADMLPHEIFEMLQGTFTKVYGAAVVELESMKPATFLGQPGFTFSFNHSSANNLMSKAFASSAVVDDQLYMIVYTAPQLHFHEKYAAQVRQIMETASLAD